MTGVRVVLLRHGQTDYNAQGRLQGQVDIPLNDVGHIQAKEAAHHVAALRPDVIISSDLLRAKVTAEYLAAELDQPIQLDERIRERSFGQWEGLTREEIKDGWPDQFKVWRTWGNPEGIDAESRSEVGIRMVSGIEAAVSAAGENKTIVVVSHGAAITAAITVLLGHDPDTWRGVASMQNCHWSVLDYFEENDPKWQLVTHNAGG